MSQVADPGNTVADTDPASGSSGGDGSGLQLRQLTKEFANFTAVKSLDLDVPAGAFFALLGPSGCGKTTTLRMVAGLETPTSGTITLAGQDITYAKPYRRPVNTVFQSYALFPHLDIFENVAFGLRRRKKSDVDKQVNEMLELVELEQPGPQEAGPALRWPAAARGARPGADQPPRGAAARRAARRTRPQAARAMQVELKRIQTDVGLTFIHVTHDQEEAMTMADTIAVMNAGVIEQMGAPEELYENPRTTFVANFLGQTNLIEGKITGRSGGTISVDMHGIAVSINADRAHTDGGEGWVGIRPEKVLIGDEGEALDAPGNTIPGGVITDVSFTGVSTSYLVRMPWGQELMVFEQNTGRRKLFRTGDKVELSWRPEYAFLLDRSQDASAGAQTSD